MTQAKFVSTTHNNKSVRYIEADLDAIKVESIEGKSVEKSGKYGVNGTFFWGSSLLGVAVNRTSNGRSAPVMTGGDKTSAIIVNKKSYVTKRGTMYCFNPPAGRIIFDDKPVVNYLDYPESSTSNVVWAIGGYSLYPWKKYKSETEYYDAINGHGDSTKLPTENTENAYRFGPKSNNARTAIGYKFSHQDGKKIILAVFSSESAYGVHEFMAGLGCTSAVMLDGGGSSQIRYKSGGKDGFWCPKPDPTMRVVHSMVTVNPTKWV
ncbi:phosphodiester glycosidase family protein [Paenibacillus agilis]|uniref:Phosphodiester glycosidase family protein n=1 Tax=Paenibacillus agilis TaxID=3020863 RepID=A0A559J2L6_9BACL|nr:phosphodiester glycosidase family protein [Paenibacillus agilis]TVX94113.1 phosphodiester glycosidase family protein [Paenibacillus agilis]